MTMLMNYDPSNDGFADLDDLKTAVTLGQKLKGLQIGPKFSLDLRSCYLDYMACSTVMEEVLGNLRQLKGKKVLTLLTAVALGKVENYVMLLFRAAKSIVKEGKSYEEISAFLNAFLSEIDCEIEIHVYQTGNDKPSIVLKIPAPNAQETNV